MTKLKARIGDSWQTIITNPGRGIFYVPSGLSTMSNPTAWTPLTWVASIEFRKQQDSTLLLFSAAISVVIASGVDQTFWFGLRVDDQPVSVAQGSWSTPTGGISFRRALGFGFAERSGFSAGTHQIVPIFRTAGASALQWYAEADFASYQVLEVAAESSSPQILREREREREAS